MRNEKYTLNDENRMISITVNPENPSVKISNNSSIINPVDEGKNCNALVVLTTIRRENQNETVDLPYSNAAGQKKLHEIPEFNDADIETIQIELKNSDCLNFEVTFEVQLGSDLIDISNPITEFNQHISNPANTKILFSAPFGQGKTTFLDFFFNRPASRYEVLRVFPVNYAVASNEDIFRYIKTDILFQLLSKDIVLDKENPSWLQSAKEFIYLHPVKTIANFIKMTMSLDKSTAVINSVISAFEPIVKEVSAYHETKKIDDKEKATEYIKEVYEREGSIFEDNFYTQLIRQLLERLKEKTNKETVLIIEDLDRMDPDHIFRILNVISAHYDTYNYGEGAGHNNKFGFDKIILVCDEENIKNIFHHKYGERTDFNGYFNKYFSSKPFHFKNHGAISQFLRKQFFDDPTGHKRSAFAKAHNVVLEALLISDQLSLRELKILLRTDFDKHPFRSEYKYYYFQQGLFYRSISFLDELFGNRLEQKLNQLTKLNIDTGREFKYYGNCLVAGLVARKGDVFSFKDQAYNIKITEDRHEDFTIVVDISKSMDGNAFPELTHVDFYELLNRTYKEFNLLKKV